MKTFKVGDLVVSAWGHAYIDGQPTPHGLGMVMGETKGFEYDHFKQDWAVYNVYWFQSGKAYPVFSHDLNLYEREV